MKTIYIVKLYSNVQIETYSEEEAVEEAKKRDPSSLTWEAVVVGTKPDFSKQRGNALDYPN